MPDQERAICSTRLFLRNQKSKREKLSCKHPRKNFFSYKLVLFALARALLPFLRILYVFSFSSLFFFTIFLNFLGENRFLESAARDLIWLVKKLNL